VKAVSHPEEVTKPNWWKRLSQTRVTPHSQCEYASIVFFV